MASDSTTAQRLLAANRTPVPLIQQQSPQGSAAAAPRILPGYASRNPIPLPSKQRTNKPKHYIDVRSLPSTHPLELFPAKPGYANPLA